MANKTMGKVLRLGVIQGGKIIEDKTIEKRESVTLGSDGKNSVVVPMSNLPKTLTVFEMKGAGYNLVFTEEMDGKLAVTKGAEQLTFATLKSQGIAQKRGDQYVVALNDDSKGKLSLGEVTLLFQFVNQPKVVPAMELPDAAKGNFFNQIDRTFTGILLMFLSIEFTGAVIISQHEIAEVEVQLEELPDRFVQMIIPEKPKEKPKPVEENKGEEPKEEKKEEKKVAEKAETKANKPPPGPKSKDELKQAVASKGLLKILGAVGDGSGGSIADVLGAGNGMNDVANALQGAGGVATANSDNLAAGSGPRGGGSGQAAQLGDLGTEGGGPVATGEKKAVQVSGKLIDASSEAETGEIDRDSLTKFVKARLKTIQGCYERELKRNPSLKGKIVMEFTIATSGRTTNVEVAENTLGSDEVGNCIRTAIRAWSTPFKPDADVPVSYPFVFAPAS